MKLLSPEEKHVESYLLPIQSRPWPSPQKKPLWVCHQIREAAISMQFLLKALDGHWRLGFSHMLTTIQSFKLYKKRKINKRQKKTPPPLLPTWEAEHWETSLTHKRILFSIKKRPRKVQRHECKRKEWRFTLSCVIKRELLCVMADLKKKIPKNIWFTAFP